ncbi:MAG TPA: WYL domain-containing protein, partial [Kofleriaceae bacterium]|nr:WYL domain-containing protein [Kofleriaceae bacterium]
PDDWWTVELPIESLDHATEQLLGLGANVEVLAPAALRARVRDGASAIATLHAQKRRRRASSARL